MPGLHMIIDDSETRPEKVSEKSVLLMLIGEAGGFSNWHQC